MLNPSSTSAGFRLDLEKKRSFGVLEEKKIGGFKQGCLFSRSNYRGDYDHEHEEKSNQICYMKEGKDEMVMSPVLSQRSYVDLLQNCDLPPPLKVFAGADKTALTSIRPTTYDKVCGEDEFPITRDSFEVEKLELLRALQLSQTRAREAEKKAKLMTQERDHLSHSFLKESLRIFSYRQWVKLLEFEVSQLQSQNEKEEKRSCCGCGCQSDRDKESSCSKKSDREKESSEEENVGSEGDVGSLTWCMALALCLGIASVGFVFGCRYSYLF